MTSIFLSYARSDDEPFVRRLYEGLTARGFDVWFDRASMPSRNLTFHQEIRDAIAARDHLLLVVGPKAAASDYVRQEWQFAWFEAEKVVTPILRLGDYPLIPDELKLLHCEDFRDDATFDLHLNNLDRILRDPPPPLGKLIAVPSLPAHYLSRTDRLIPLRDAVRSGLDSPAPFGGAAARQQFHGIAGVSKHVGMHGMGGIGKSILANLLAHDRKIREAFPDGIVWIGLGSVPNVVELMRRVHRDFGGDGAFATEHEGKTKLKDIFADKAVLLVLDDAWRRSDIEAFDCFGPRCRALITTRDAGLFTSIGGTHHLVELLTDDEALRLLALAVDCQPEELPAQAHQLLKKCGRLPLAVSLAGGMVAAKMPWDSLLKAFDRHKLEFLKDDQRTEDHQNLLNMIEISVRALDPAEQTRLVELGVFPEDETVPEAAVATLWQHTGNLDDLDTQALLLKLKQRSLLHLTAPTDHAATTLGRVSLHDLIHHYCLRRAPIEFGQPTALHDRLLDAYRKISPNGWWTGPNDGYFLAHLRDHLIAANRAGDLADLLHELRWLETKNEAGLTFDLTADFYAALKTLPTTGSRHRILRLLDEALRRDIHFIARHSQDYPQGLFQCLWNSCWWYDCPEAAQYYEQAPAGTSAEPPPWELPGARLAGLLEYWRSEKENTLIRFSWVRSLRPPSNHLGAAQKQVLRGHDAVVKSVAISRDGQRIVSGSYDGTVRVWHSTSGAQFCSLSCHESHVRSAAVSPDGKFIVTGSEDGKVRFWDVDNEVELPCLRHHGAAVHCVAFSPDGKRVAAGARDGTINVWATVDGAMLHCMDRHRELVLCVAFSFDGRRMVSGSWDRTLRIWDAASGTELACLSGHSRGVTSAVFSPDKNVTRIVSGSEDCTVRVWDASNGVEVLRLTDHRDPVKTVACSSDGRLIASGSSVLVTSGTEVVSWSKDHLIRVWDAVTGKQLRCLHGHEGGVTSVVFFPDGQRLVSGSDDRTVRIWDAASCTEPRRFRGHTTERVWKVEFSPDGHYMASQSWNDKSQCDKSLRIWNAATGVELRRIYGREDGISIFAISGDGKRIATIGSSNKAEIEADERFAQVWDAYSGTELGCLRAHGDPMSSIAFSPDGRLIATGSRHNVRIWDAITLLEIHNLSGHESWVNQVSFSTDGQRLLTGSWDGTVRIWDTVNGTALHCMHGHRGRVNCLAISPDGSLVASGGSDGTLRLWNATSGTEMFCLLGHKDELLRIAFSTDGKRIVSVDGSLDNSVGGSSDNVVRTWDTSNGACLEIIHGRGDVSAIARGLPQFPMRAVQCNSETVIQSAETREPFAWFPLMHEGIATHPSGRIWGAPAVNHVCLFTLERGG